MRTALACPRAARRGSATSTAHHSGARGAVAAGDRFGVPPARAPRRVVVTGLGAVTPLGVGVGPTWERLLAGRSGISSLQDAARVNPALGAFPSQVAGWIPRPADAKHAAFEDARVFDIAAYVSKAAMRTQGVDFIGFAVACAQEALADAGLAGGSLGPYHPTRFGVAIGCGIGCIEEVGTTAALMLPPNTVEAGQRKVGPFFVPRILTNMAAGNVSINHGLQGPNHSVSTACATGAHAIGDAFRFIKYGDADAMLCGGTEASINAVSLAGFSRARALSTGYNATPAAASRPFDAGRDGFVLGEGAGLLVLEELESARARGARIYAEVRGYGACGDAFHITAPREDGDAAYRCMAAALAEGGLTASDVDYVNAHATSTPLGDNIEGHGLGRLFGSEATHAALCSSVAGYASRPEVAAGLEAAKGTLASRGGRKPLVSSTKGAVGHLLGAAGAVEAIFTVLSIANGAVPATLNLEKPDPALPSDVCDFVAAPGGGASAAVQAPVAAALSNSFGFGGTNCSLLFTAPPPPMQ